MDLVKSPIISASRRTDIPAFLMYWVMEKIRQKHVKVVNPFNRSQISNVSLDPKDVTAWVWWSKNFSPWINSYKNNPKIFDQYPVHIFNFTINSVSKLESGLNLPLDERFKQVQWLINKYGNDVIQFRFDPIVFYQIPDDTTIHNNLSDFNYIVSKISEFGGRKVIFSFADELS